MAKKVWGFVRFVLLQYYHFLSAYTPNRIQLLLQLYIEKTTFINFNFFKVIDMMEKKLNKSKIYSKQYTIKHNLK